MKWVMYRVAFSMPPSAAPAAGLPLPGTIRSPPHYPAGTGRSCADWSPDPIRPAEYLQGGPFWEAARRVLNLSREPRDRILISWDIALSETEAGDFSVGLVLLCRQETFYVLD